MNLAPVNPRRKWPWKKNSQIVRIHIGRLQIDYQLSITEIAETWDILYECTQTLLSTNSAILRFLLIGFPFKCLEMFEADPQDFLKDLWVNIWNLGSSYCFHSGVEKNWWIKTKTKVHYVGWHGDGEIFLGFSKYHYLAYYCILWNSLWRY